jgi:hypothetical protein
MNEMYSLPSDWMIIARKDWNRIHRMLEYDDAEASAVFLQQALEKYLKAAKYKPELENFRALCERVSGYYFVERYPPLCTSDLMSEDITNDLTVAKKFVKMMFPLEKI